MLNFSETDVLAPTVDILLATYIAKDSPEVFAYLKKQIQSIEAQDYPGEIRLIIRDDGSTNTNALEYLKSKALKNPKIILLEDDSGNLGHVKNFERLLESSTADYILFCDQDDFWHPTKIRESIEQIQVFEN